MIEERKSLPKSHPHYLLLKIIANALYGIFAELNRFDYGKNAAKHLEVFSGELKFDQPTFVVERPGRWQFPPAAALITAGGAFFASVRADGDILPVRALYSDGGDTNIGLNPLTRDQPLWYAGPDLAASKLKTKRAPQIIRAFRLVPQGVQTGMRAIAIGSRTIDPSKDDFFRTVIEERNSLPKSHPHYLLLKIIANALYGIFAELNRFDYGKNAAKHLEVFSG